MRQERVQQQKLLRYSSGMFEDTNDIVAVEEPLEIRLGYGPADDRLQKSLSITMRTPGNDFELATGFLFTEGIINEISEINNIHYCSSGKVQEQKNIVRVEISPSIRVNWKKLERHFYTSSSCGVCGKSSIEAVQVHCAVIRDKFELKSGLICQLPEKLHKHQPVFTYTGGLHGAALATIEGNMIYVREDVGRHNAVDKVIGAAIYERNVEGKILVVSGRASFELVQKAARAGIPVLVAVGAPSSLAIEMAEATGMTLVGFTKSDRFNVYCGMERICKN